LFYHKYKTNNTFVIFVLVEKSRCNKEQVSNSVWNWCNQNIHKNISDVMGDLWRQNTMSHLRNARVEKFRTTKKYICRNQKWKPCSSFSTIRIKDNFHKEFVLQDKTVNGDYYLDVMKRLLARIGRVRSSIPNASWSLLHSGS